MRAWAILLMAQTHFVLYGSSPEERASGFWQRLPESAGTFAAPIFLFLVGMSYYLSWRRRSLQGVPDRDISARKYRRGVAIFFVGLAHAAVVWGPRQIFMWDVLTLIGLAVCLLTWVKRLPIWGLCGMVAAVLLLSPVFRGWFHFTSYWDFRTQDYAAGLDPTAAFLGLTATGYFPVFPWVAFPLAGLICARVFFGDAKRPAIGVAAAAAILMGIGVYRGLATGSFAMFPARTGYVIFMLGFCPALFLALRRAVDGDRRTYAAVDFFQLYSRYALTTYVLHLAILIVPMRLAGHFLKQNEYAYYMNLSSPGLAFAVSIVYLIMFYFLLKLWDDRGGRYSLEWMLRRLAAGRCVDNASPNG